MPKPNNTLVQSYPVTIFPDPPKDEDTRVTPPSVTGEQSLSGDMPDPEADDDVLANEQQVGLHVTEDEENPEEIDIAAEIEAAERQRRGI